MRRRCSISTEASPRASLRVDAHHHVWDLAVRDQPWTRSIPALHRSFAIEELRPALVRHAVDQTVVVQTVCVAAETPELLALAATDPHVAGVVGWLDLTATDVEDRLAALRAGPGGDALVAIRHQVQDEPDPNWLARADVRGGLQVLARRGLRYDLVITPAQLPAALEAVRGCPGLSFVLDHGAKPAIADHVLEPWTSQLRALSRLPNVAVKFSGLVTEAGPSWQSEDLRPYVERLLEAFGPGRVMFGSDWPVCTAVADYDQVIAAAETLTTGLSATERADVFGQTAARWYGLPR